MHAFHAAVGISYFHDFSLLSINCIAVHFLKYTISCHYYTVFAIQKAKVFLKKNLGIKCETYSLKIQMVLSVTKKLFLILIKEKKAIELLFLSWHQTNLN